MLVTSISWQDIHSELDICSINSISTLHLPDLCLSFSFVSFSVVVLSQTMSLSIKKDSSCINSIFYDILSRLHVFDHFSDVFLYCS